MQSVSSRIWTRVAVSISISCIFMSVFYIHLLCDLPFHFWHCACSILYSPYYYVFLWLNWFLSHCCLMLSKEINFQSGGLFSIRPFEVICVKFPKLKYLYIFISNFVFDTCLQFFFFRVCYKVISIFMVGYVLLLHLFKIPRVCLYHISWASICATYQFSLPCVRGVEKFLCYTRVRLS